MAFGSGDVGLHAPVQKLPLLALGGGQIVEDIGAGEIVELVLPDVGVDRHQGMGTDSVLVSRRHTPGENPLALSLAVRLLIVVIRNLQAIPRQEQVEMERVLTCGLKVETIEQSLIVPNVVEGPELGSVQKTAAAHSIDAQKVAEFRGAIAQAETASSGAERTVVRVDVSEHPPRAEAGARRDVCHQAGLVAELGLGRPRRDTSSRRFFRTPSPSRGRSAS